MNSCSSYLLCFFLPLVFKFQKSAPFILIKLYCYRFIGIVPVQIQQKFFMETVIDHIYDKYFSREHKIKMH